MHRKSMEAAHTLNNDILKDRGQEDSSEESDDDSCSDRKPNIHQQENKDDLREVEDRIYCSYLLFSSLFWILKIHGLYHTILVKFLSTFFDA